MDVVSFDYKLHQRSQFVSSQIVYHSFKTKNSCFLHEKKVIFDIFVPNHITYHKSLTVSAKDLCCPWNAQHSPSINKIMVDENDSLLM